MSRKRQRQPEQRTSDQSNEAYSPADYEKVGPRSIEGVEASDLPDKGRGDTSTEISKEAGRKLPQQTGQWGSGDTGLRANANIADAKKHGRSRKHT